MTFWSTGALIPASEDLNTMELRSFHFFQLPGELRNKIYDLVFQECELEIWSNHPQKELKQRQSHAARDQDGPKKARFRLHSRCLTTPSTPNIDRDVDVHRLRHIHQQGCTPKLCSEAAHSRFNQPVSLLQTCHKANMEAIPFLYAKTAFRFNSSNTINKFLNTAPAAGSRAIQKVGLKHVTYGEPQLTEFRSWKRSHDQKWMKVCKRISEEMSSMNRIDIELRICDWPTQLNLAAAWARPLLVLRGEGLERVDALILHSSFPEPRLDAAARMVEDAMMTEAGKQKKQHEIDMAQIREMEAKEAKEAREREWEREKLRAPVFKVLTIKMGNLPAPKKSAKGVHSNKTGSIIHKATKVNKTDEVDIMARKKHSKRMQF